jgi:Tol biopolymer transport system component
MTKAMMRVISGAALAMVVAAAPIAAQKPQAAETLMQTANKKEVVDGDLAGAIEIYKKAVAAAKGNRVLAATALEHMAECYQKLGDAEAQKIYQRIVKEYGEQKDVVAQAQARLASLSDATARKAPGLTTRQLWTGRDTDYWTVPPQIAPTADGRMVLFVEWNSGDLFTRDLATGEVKRLGLKTSRDGSEYFEQALYSPDQRQIAVSRNLPDRSWSFEIISTQPGAKSRVLIKGRDIHPVAWSADSKSILVVSWNDSDATSPRVSPRIAWVSATDGTQKTVKSFEAWRAPEKVSLSPDGGYIAYDALEREETNEDRDIYIVASDGSSETLAVRNPGIDKNPVWTPDGSDLIFISNRSRNFGLYSIAVKDGKVQGSPRLLKPDVGNITLSGFVRSGALYYLQPTGDQNVYQASFDPVSGELRGVPVPLGNTYATNNGMSAISSDGKRVAYLATRAGVGPPSLKGVYVDPGASAVVVKSVDGRMERSYSNDLMLSWAPMWLPDGAGLLLAARRQPSGNGQAFYRLDLDSGRITRLLEHTVNWTQPGAARGQRELSADGETVYLSVNVWNESKNGAGGIAAVSLSTGQVKRIYEADGAVESVSISPDNRSLAAITGRGATMTGRKLVVMNIDGSGLRTLFEPPADALPIVGVSGVAWSSDGKRVFFVRPEDDHGNWRLWQVPVNGGPPSDTGFQTQELREIRGGPNGTLTYTAGRSELSELWAMDNLLPMLKSGR